MKHFPLFLLGVFAGALLVAGLWLGTYEHDRISDDDRAIGQIEHYLQQLSEGNR